MDNLVDEFGFSIEHWLADVDEWHDTRAEREAKELPSLTCGGVGVNYTIAPDGRIRWG